MAFFKRFFTYLKQYKYYSLNSYPEFKLQLSNSRNKLRRKQRESVSSTISMQILGNGVDGTPKSLLINTDRRSYLFNCGEGTQRHIDSMNMKLNKITKIFITQKHWNNLGGFIGFALTAQSRDTKRLTLIGPPDIDDIVIGMNRFVHDLVIKIDKSENYQDETFEIENIPIFSSKNELNICIAFICNVKSLPRRLDLEKCVELNIEPGPLINKLNNGENVIFNGKLIKSDDVFTHLLPPDQFLIVDCANEDFLDSLLDNNRLKNMQNANKVEIIVHFTPNDILNDPKYIKWMSKFKSSVKHLILNESCPGLTNFPIINFQHQLNLINSRIFPLLKTSKTINDIQINNTTLGEPFLIYNIRPKIGFDRCKIKEFDPEIELNEIKNMPKWPEMYKLFKNSMEKYEMDQNSGFEYPKIVFLGTRSATPSAIRNVSCILIELNEGKYAILDCGEGSYGQILRFFGPDETEKILINLSLVFLSHNHSDHHTGFMQILHEREKIGRRKALNRFYVVSPGHLNHWLMFYHQKFNLILNQFTFVQGKDLYPRGLWSREYLEMFDDLDLRSFCTTKVDHVALTFAAIITLKNGLKIVYSSDTMPCRNLIEAGQNCDLLIHEATMDDSLTELALSKTHSTTSQAIDVGHRMGAKFTILTHFSTRYDKIPIITDNLKNNVGIAFDNMQITLKDLKLTSLFNPILKFMFSDLRSE